MFSEWSLRDLWVLPIVTLLCRFLVSLSEVLGKLGDLDELCELDWFYELGELDYLDWSDGSDELGKLDDSCDTNCIDNVFATRVTSIASLGWKSQKVVVSIFSASTQQELLS